jgi:hypothetical protein
MTGRATTAILVLLCALMLGAIGASTATAKGTTAFTCVTSEAGGAGFSDEHCTQAVGTGAKFEHVAIANKKVTKVVGTNTATQNETKESTNGVLSGTLGGLATEIVCTTMNLKGLIENNEAFGVMRVFATQAAMKFQGCKVPKPANAEGKERCKVSGEEFEAPALGAMPFEEGEEMGLQFSSETSRWTEILFEEGPGGKCPVAGKAVPLEGAENAVASGATLVYVPGKPGTLILGGQKAKLAATFTIRMDPEGGAQQSPISLTTTNP